MVFGVTALGGALWSSATGAYNYNMNRFQFDAGQRQSSAHFKMNMRMSQWNLFREDLRDLFALTTTNLSTYMVKGTLFLGFAMNFVREAKTFPIEPYWLLLLWGNCVVTALSFSLLAVWLAMHGTISAHSTNVKMMTQTVRPPIATTEEIEEVRFDRTKYHSSGLDMLRPPDLLPPVHEDSPSVSSHESAPLAGGHPSTANQQSQSLGASATATGGPSMMLVDAEGIESGKTAAFDGHVKLFKALQSTYAQFDAYARISLCVAVNSLLLVCTYWIIAFFMVHPNQKGPWIQRLMAWEAVFMFVVASRIILKLDLFVHKAKEHMLKEVYLAGPLCGCLAGHLYAAKAVPDIAIDLTAMFRCISPGTFCGINLLY